MRTVFLLASELGPTGAARQLGRLAAGLPRDRFRVDVGVLGPADTPVARDLRAAGVPVQALRVRNLLDVRGMRAVRWAVNAAAPAVVHAWGPEAVRVSRLLRRGEHRPGLVASAASVHGGGLSGWLADRQLRRADRVVPTTWADAERYRRLGVAADSLTRIAPGVTPPAPAPDRAAFLRELGLPATARLIVTAGRVEPSPAMKVAVWTFDMLRYDFPDIHLLVFGAGPDRAGLEAFGRALAFDDFRVRFPGCRPDLPAVLGLADVVWVTHPHGGVNLALEAMAAGRPVVGWQAGDLDEVVLDGATGHLVAPGDRTQLAGRSHELLREPARSAALGEAGRRRAAEHFGVGRMTDQYARVYEELAPR